VQGPLPASSLSSTRLFVNSCSAPAHPGSIGMKMVNCRHSSVISGHICIFDVLLSILVPSRCCVSVRRPRGTVVRYSRPWFRICDSMQSFRSSATSVSVPSSSSSSGINFVKCTDLSLPTYTLSSCRAGKMTVLPAVAGGYVYCFLPPCLSKRFGNSILSNYCEIFTF